MEITDEEKAQHYLSHIGYYRLSAYMYPLLSIPKEQRFVIDGKLLKNKVIECALNLDADLISLLLQNDTIKKHFFQPVGEVLVFDKVKFQKFVSNKQFLPDSYTAFKNKIGLISGDEFVADKKEWKDVYKTYPEADYIEEL